MAGWRVSWLGWLAGWLAGGLAVQIAGWRAGVRRVAGELAGEMAGWRARWLTGWLARFYTFFLFGVSRWGHSNLSVSSRFLLSQRFVFLWLLFRSCFLFLGATPYRIVMKLPQKLIFGSKAWEI